MFFRPQIQRSATGIPKSQSSNAEFRLEIEDDTNVVNYSLPKLYEPTDEDLHDVFKPVEVPKIR